MLLCNVQMITIEQVFFFHKHLQPCVLTVGELFSELSVGGSLMPQINGAYTRLKQKQAEPPSACATIQFVHPLQFVGAEFSESLGRTY